MGSSADAKFTRFGVQEIGGEEMGSSAVAKFTRLGVYEMGIAADSEFRSKATRV